MKTLVLKRQYREEIRRAISQLRRFLPEKIILYGSAARGDVREGSDLDFLLVKRTKKPFLERNIEATSYLDLGVPYDVFVVTPEEVEKGEREGEPFFVDMLKNGKVVYAR